MNREGVTDGVFRGVMISIRAEVCASGLTFPKLAKPKLGGGVLRVWRIIWGNGANSLLPRQSRH